MALSPSTLHLIFETAGYFIGGQIFWWQRRRLGDAVAGPDRWLAIGAAIFGAAIGSRLLAALETPWLLSAGWTAFSGKTIVGALLGGLILVEAVKKMVGVTRSTGDLYALPLCVGMAVGRIGCFLAGLSDQTHGNPTSLPWGHDYGDGIPRHPAQIYEIVFLIVLAIFLFQTRRRKWRAEEGDEFKLFLSAYLAFRLLIDFLKPGFPLAGLTAIQWACVCGLIYYARDIHRWLTTSGRTSSTTPQPPSALDASAR